MGLIKVKVRITRGSNYDKLNWVVPGQRCMGEKMSLRARVYTETIVWEVGRGEGLGNCQGTGGLKKGLYVWVKSLSSAQHGEESLVRVLKGHSPIT